VEVIHSEFSFDEYEALLVRERASIAAFKEGRQRAFDEERERWKASGQLQFSSESDDEAAVAAQANVPKGARAVESHVSGSIWKIAAEPGSKVEAGAPLVIVESMKMEVTVEAPCAGTVAEVLCREGKPVSAGQAVVILREAMP
jgi:urea carboxylase